MWARSPAWAATLAFLANWTVYTAFERLNACEQPVLFDFAIHNPVDDPNTVTKLRTCTAGTSNGTAAVLAANQTSGTCLPYTTKSQVSLDIATTGRQGYASMKDLDAALDKVQSYLDDPTNCDATFIVGRSKTTIVAVYSGRGIDNRATTSAIIRRLATEIVNSTTSKTVVLELCGDGRNADRTLGVAIDNNGDIAAIQKAVATWSNATCVSGMQISNQMKDVTIFESPRHSASNSTSSHQLVRRGDCKTATVISGDSCGSLASKCGISASDFTKYNSDPKLCSSLTPGQHVCCSAGTPPDFSPRPNADGSCASYTVKTGDTCSSIAANNGLKVADVSKFNDKTTWGWFGCNDLMAGLAICLSTGTPQMPAFVANAVCGPTVPGTKPPAKGENMTDLNPCPLNACCDIWGQCGITPEYCTAETGPQGNPGTAPPNHNGCISNCGTKMANNGNGPNSFKKIGYYESWNWDRSCLNMRAADLDSSTYTHAHWGFATITDSFDASINDTYKQWDDFTSLYGVKKIVSFGGWGYSTDTSTYDVLRKAMDPANAGTFTTNIVNFLNKNNLDGVDFDWEYAGAPDIPGIPPGLKTDGPNYLSFLQTLRGKMPAGKTISIAAPASFWYLKSFPIAKMVKELDYIVYMTYDLHGQWDYGNQFSQDGCPTGSCLRSHVNLTETNYALAMITKAGVPANIISVGVSSYGRSFGMTQAGCTGPMCHFGGPDSTAAPGICTVTAGCYISNAEILNIIGANDTSIKSWYDTDSNSDILVYNGTQWVAYMTDVTKDSRTGYYKSLNFGGTVDWAVDLHEFTGDDGAPSDNDDDDLPLPAPTMPDCTASYTTLDDLGAAGNIPDNCKAYCIVSTLGNVLSAAVKNYTDMMNDGYDGKFDTYSHAVADSAGSTVRDFVNNNGNKYFSCIISETAVCCDYCKGGAHPADQCNYCFDGACYKTCNSELGCSTKRDVSPLDGHEAFYGEMQRRDHPFPERVLISKMVNETEPCPPDYSKRGYGPDNPYEQSVYWSLDSDKANNFWADLLDNTGIPKDKIQFKSYDRGNDCAPSAKPDDDCWGIGYDYGMPTPSSYSAGDVANPKDVVQKALSNSKDLQKQISDAATSLKLNCWDGDGFELVDSISLPVLMIAEAVNGMAQVDSVADKIDEEKRKALILAFLGAILFFVPVAGEVLGAVTELADIASIITILGAVGNAAMDVYTIVDDPSNAPLAIFSLILEHLALADLAKITRAANIRRGMTDADVAKLGDKVADSMGTIKKITGVCPKTS
ncbi:killer toxin alpha/beta [Rhizodiscina lignyota]|uniref:chitinase n=1 Tax=Rhizodiscina lignyota TaxID=1504668 RepID=A0A9P4I3X8_9PEZI|nr:killer toxin alpha/beta [Rhizodiscina lignyota]